MNSSEGAFDCAIAASMESVAVPEFPSGLIYARIGNRRPGKPPIFSRRLSAAAAIAVCCAGLAYGTPKIVNEIQFHVGNAQFKLSTPQTKALGKAELGELAAERSFHARLPVGWPAYMRPVAAWQIGPPRSRFYIVQYSSVGDRSGGSGAVVFLQSARSSTRASIGPRPHSTGPEHKQTSWISGDERITIVSKNLSAAELQRIREQTK